MKLADLGSSVVEIELDNGKKVKYNKHFLRDSCSSGESVDPHSKQKLFSTAQIVDGLSVKDIKVSKSKPEKLEISWIQDEKVHKSLYPKEFLKKYSSEANCRKGKFFHDERVYWNRLIIETEMSKMWIKFDDYANDKSTWVKTLDNLSRYGICFIEDLPDPLEDPKTQSLTEENASLWPVATLAQKFGYIKKTFYGTLFDVKNEKKAKNIANTQTFLPMHMDLLYYESPPGLQFLHFIQNSTLGGENVFADSYAAADYVRRVDKEAYEALKLIPITFHYNNNNEFYYYRRPMIVEEKFRHEYDGEPILKEVNYSPPFQGPFEVGITGHDTSGFEKFLRGFKIFEDFVNDERNQIRIKMKERTCVVFDNRRTLHSRLSFSDSNGGDRWLMGCYVDGDSFRSKLRTRREEGQI